MAAALGSSLLAAAYATPPAAARGRTHASWLRPALAAERAGQLDRAYLAAAEAVQAHPGNPQWVALRNLLRQRAEIAHLQRAHQLAVEGRHGDAALQYRAALQLDPDDPDARRGLAAQYPLTPPPPAASTEMRVHRAAAPVNLEPAPGRRAFHFRLGLRQAVARVAEGYALKALVANDVPGASIRMDVADANFSQAMAALHALSGLSWIPIDPHTIYVDTDNELRDREPYATRTFYLPWVSDGVMLNQVSTAVRTLLGIREISADVTAKALTLRATPEELDAAEAMLLDLRGSAGEVVLQFRILELNASTARDLGVSVPDQFTMFSLGPLLEQLQQSGSLSQNILSLFTQGGLNAVLSSGLLSAGALSQAQSLLSPLLQNPFVVFGGGATLMAVSIPNLAAKFSASESSVSTLETALLRATSGQQAELRIGEQYPVINASFAPVTLNSALDKLIGNGTFIQPFPSFTFEDLGLDAKVSPRVTADGLIRLQLDLTVKGLTGVSNNNIPILSNRHVLSAVNLRDGIPVLVAGLFSRQEMRTLAGLPGLTEVPGFGQLFSDNNLQSENDELALLITPHIVRLPARQSAETWLPPYFTPLPGPVPFSPFRGRFPGRIGLGGGQ